MLNEIFILLGIKSSKQINFNFSDENSFLMNVCNVLNSENANKILCEIPNNNFQNNNMFIQNNMVGNQNQFNNGQIFLNNGRGNF